MMLLLRGIAHGFSSIHGLCGTNISKSLSTAPVRDQRGTCIVDTCKGWPVSVTALSLILKKYDNDVSCEFDEYKVDIHLCKLCAASIAPFLSSIKYYNEHYTIVLLASPQQ